MKRLATLLIYLAFLAGCVSVVYGVWQWSQPAAWVVAGAFVLFNSLAMARANFTPPGGASQ